MVTMQIFQVIDDILKLWRTQNL